MVYARGDLTLLPGGSGCDSIARELWWRCNAGRGPDGGGDAEGGGANPGGDGGYESVIFNSQASFTVRLDITRDISSVLTDQQ